MAGIFNFIKANRKKILLGLIFLLLISTFSDFSKKETPKDPGAPEERYFISSRERPSIREAIFKPLDFVPNEEQIVYVKVENEKPIKKVIATVTTDKKTKTYELKLLEGNENKGTWRGSWRINDTHNYTYTTTLKAESGDDKSVVELNFPLGTKRTVEKPIQEINSVTWAKIAVLALLILILIASQTKFHKKILGKKLFRILLILLIDAAITLSFIPGIFDLKPQKAYAAIPSGVIVMWPSTNASIPSGWSRVTGLDGRFVKQIPNSSTNPGTTGGSSTHTHTMTSHSHSANSHSHSGSTVAYDGGYNSASGSPNGSSLTVVQAYVTIFIDNARYDYVKHIHPLSLGSTSPGNTGSNATSYSSGTSEPPYFEVIFIKSDGSPTGIPNGAIVWWNSASLPTGWRATDGAGGAPDLRNRLIKGATGGGNGGGTGGTSNSHQHSSASNHDHSAAPSHTHSIGSIGNIPTMATGTGAYNELINHSHSANTVSVTSGATGSFDAASVTTSASDGLPSWIKSYAIQNNSGGESAPANIITMWDGTIAGVPAGWFLADGNGGRPNLSQGRFTRALNTTGELNTTGGGTHSHSGSHTHSGGSHSHSGSGSTTSTNPGIQGTNQGGNYITDPCTPPDTCTGGGTSVITASYDHSHNGGSTAADSPSTGSADASTDSVSADPTFTTVAYTQFSNSNPNAPTIMGSSPIAGSKPNKNANTITLQGTATDPDASDTVQIDWDYSSDSGGGWTNIGTTTLGTQGTTQSLSWTVSGLTAGSGYRLRARTIDNGGATSSYTTQSSNWTLTSGCSPPVSGNLTIASSCAFPETVDGVDAGDVTINSSVTLTINAAQTVVFNALKSITVNGSTAVNSTGQIRQTNLWMIDSDADGWPSTAVQSAQDSSPGGTYRRRNLLNSDRIIDCNDAALSSTNSC